MASKFENHDSNQNLSRGGNETGENQTGLNVPIILNWLDKNSFHHFPALPLATYCLAFYESPNELGSKKIYLLLIESF